jgi:hypothetical protein
LVLQRIVEREAEQRVQPRRDRAFNILSAAVFLFATRAAWDYAITHPDANPDEIPPDPIEALDFWAQGMPMLSSSRPRMSDGRSFLLEEGIALVAKARKVAESDRDLLPSDVVVAIDNLSQTFGGYGEPFFELMQRYQGHEAMDYFLLVMLVPSVRELGAALRRSGGARWNETGF